MFSGGPCQGPNPFYLSIYRALAEFVEILSLGVCIVFGGGVWCSLGNFLAECYYLAEGYFLAEGYSWGVLCFRGALARARNISLQTICGFGGPLF